ncbi:uncharacterized membrane protein (DUF485 family) [Azonexus fungiphilus]|uniref:Uncharacterized membrane protein (DUF485 family) n=1 Tax=Azonexus fungiphilus TaxID=146940 RepID=A0A495VKH4_9RHOO|nr:DUF485 domain-containing protein [Azonexus fungiphilus]RKT49891.1 uncharacterized membrane protein (DUF485 family) [Azonexus fungiphilus]
MSQEIYARIRANPKYQQLKDTRNAYGWVMTIIMLVVYYGYIALIAFDKEFLAAPLSASGVTTLGIPIGVGVIAFTIIITGIYVRRANGEFDKLKAEIIKEVQ